MHHPLVFIVILTIVFSSITSFPSRSSCWSSYHPPHYPSSQIYCHSPLDRLAFLFIVLLTIHLLIYIVIHLKIALLVFFTFLLTIVLICTVIPL